MKKKWYRNTGAKTAFAVAAVVSMTAAAVGAGLVTGCAFNGIEAFDNSDYLKSRTFAGEMFRDVSELMSALNGMEVVGDGTGEIDLGEILEEKPVTHTETSGLAYSEEDLAAWAKEGGWMDGTPNVLECTQQDGAPYYMYYEDFLQQVTDGELELNFYEGGRWEAYYEAEGQSPTEVVLSALEAADYSSGVTGIADLGVWGVTDKSGKTLYTDIKNYNWAGDASAAIRELYKPVGADSILDVVNEEPQWQGKLDDAYEALNQALAEFRNVGNYDEILSQYEQGKTNLNYIYVNKDSGAVYTNTGKKSLKTLADVQDFVKSSKRSYVLATPEETSGNLNLRYYNASVWTHMLDSMTNNTDYILAAFVDNSLPVDDSIARDQREFDTYADWMLPALIGTAAALLIFLISVAFLTAGAGRSNEDGEVRLNFFDRWYTEIGAAAVIGAALLGIYGIYLVARATGVTMGNYIAVAEYMIVFGMFGFVLTLVFLFGWMSLVKRVKAHVFWKNSLTGKLFGLIRKLLHFAVRGVRDMAELFAHHTASRLKMALIFGGFCLFQFVVCGMFFGSGVMVLFLLLVAADVAGLVYLLKKARGRELILEGLKKITDGDLQYKIPLENLTGEQREIADYINRIGEGLDAAVESSVKNERMKTELITNVSHDIKTPLTSIINYVDLLKRENPADPKIKGYLDILEEKAQRLKNLTEDVVEASKASTGNIALEMTSLNFVELVQQVIGEFEERFRERNLSLMVHFDNEEAIICADGRRLWRVLENIFGNAAKYAMENTRVYAEVKVEKPNVIFSLKNISAQPLNISADELTERFIRGDVSRNTEGSGLGLSIAKSLTELQKGEFRLYLDGDLFKVTIVFKAE